MSKARPSVYVLGEAMIELSEVEGDSARLGVAGDTFNTAVYLARLGLDVQYLTAIGDCPFSDRIRQACNREGIGTSHMLVVPGGTPGLYAVSLDEHGERSFTYWRAQSAARCFFETVGWQAACDRAAEADLFYLSGITLSLFRGEARPRLFSVLEERAATSRRTAFDPNYRPRGWSSAEEARKAIERAAGLSAISMPTFEDEAALFGDASAEDCARRHAGLGAQEVVVKDGASGAYLPGHGWVPPPVRVRPRDTTGAGDSFNAGYLAARLAGQTPTEAAAKGHELAARVLMTSGAILPMR